MSFEKYSATEEFTTTSVEVIPPPPSGEGQDEGGSTGDPTPSGGN